MDSEAIARGCKALGHPARVRIVQLLAEQTECRGAEVFSELPLAQSTVSEHLRVLKDAGLVHTRVVGTSAVYCLDPDVLESLGAGITELAAGYSPCDEQS